MLIGFKWLKIGSIGGIFEHCNETSGSINGGDFFIKLQTFIDSAPLS
jgi:hypothetical protein